MRPLDEKAEAELVRRARSGSSGEKRAAQRELFDGLRDKVLALCFNLTGSAAEAEDAAQDAFVAAFQGLGAFRGDSQFSTWLYRIAMRIALRSRQRNLRSAGEQMPELSTAHPEERLISRESARRCLAALDALSADQRAVVSLCAIDGMEYKQVASVLGIPEGTVWSRLHLARKKMAAAIAGTSSRESCRD